MQTKELKKPNYIFETSWEICNMIGGIYTVLSTKAPLLQKEYGDHYITIGPDVWKETRANPDFIEDRQLLAEWREAAAEEGLHFRVGRWNIPSRPIALLVDFTGLFPEKDTIFFSLWEKYKVDSISGGWDYIEPAMFGYAVGKVIENFYKYNLSFSDQVVAHFHEWMTGTGVLYLNEFVPQVATIFTTHATTIGRAISGNGLALYGKMEQYNGEAMARSFGMISRFSLEQKTAQNADAFTVVSNTTAREAEKLLKKAVDVVTPNGFSKSMILDEKDASEKREKARAKLFQVADALFNKKIPRDTFITLTSGRYEFRNKGINLFIEAIGQLARQHPDKEILAFIKIPANQSGPRPELQKRLESPDFDHPTSGEYLTHGLYEIEHDAILKEIKKTGLKNQPGDKVRIIFVPAYLNGQDGIFDLNYYTLLTGSDFTVFPSYYEPWGYTPLESVAFRVPTLTTEQAGFGQWVKTTFDDNHPGIVVANRTDDNDADMVEQIRKALLHYAGMSKKQMLEARENAAQIATAAQWENFIDFYRQAYSIALEKVAGRVETFPTSLMKGKKKKLTETPSKDLPIWKRVTIEPSIPEKLKGLQELSRNLWWSWNYKAAELFESINPVLWKEFDHNPIVQLDSLNIYEWEKLEKDQDFLQRYHETYDKFKKYLDESKNKPAKQIAYFSMEYGLHQSLKLYSGGLGILAGDYLKECSDSNENLVAVGLLYRFGYFQQSISLFGDQVAEYQTQKFSQLPVQKVLDEDGNQLEIKIGLPGRLILARVWRCDVGRIPLFLLDTDFEKNTDFDRTVTHKLYGGDLENRLKQEILLGVGGIRVLKAMGLEPDIFHSNEGHSAFIGLERLRYLIQAEKLDFNEALEVVRSSTLFTTHTPVPAGHDYFSEDLLRTYFPHYPGRLNISWNDMMNLGKFHPNNPHEEFSMSVLAARMSQEINGVSRIHGRVSQNMFAPLYEGYYPEESHIGYVTNGVHLPTWATKPWKMMYKKVFGEDYKSNQLNFDMWKRIQQVDDAEIWKTRKQLKKEMIDYISTRLGDEMTKRQENPKLVIDTIEAIKGDALTIGFARRFATYKRAKLLFSNLERLARLVNATGRPLLFIYAGKAHPRDTMGQELIKKIIEISKTPDFIGKVVFLGNYDIELAQKLIPGVDIWLNTPTRPLEASGTSGEKAIMNGVVNLSVLDGWWAEGYQENAGFAVSEARTYANQHFQDELDAEIIYNLFEEQIVPLYYDVNKQGVPERWVQYIKNTISEVAPNFTMKRMLEDYHTKFYDKLIHRAETMNRDNYKLAGEYAAWKQEMTSKWPHIRLEKLMVPDSTTQALTIVDDFSTEVVIYTNGIKAEHLGVEVIFGKKSEGKVSKILFSKEMPLIEVKESMARYAADIHAFKAGTYNYAFRIFPKHELMPHRQDFCLQKWV
ncbi:MAG: alpha-glucan family phosphorylase [Bacteroidales bacterium]|nr:alpha-glucan family phosphorylase [Bacteroidales bacterium]